VASLGTTGASSVGASDRAVSANLNLNGAVRLEYAGAGEATSRSFTVSGSGVTLASSGTTGAIEFTSSANVAFSDAGASTRELRLAGTNTGDNTFAASAAGTPAAADRFSRIVKNEVGKWIVAGSGTTFADNLQVEVNAGLLAFGQASQLRSGSAVVNGGTLSVSSGANTNASVTVNGGTLGGAASLGAVTVNNSGALSPGNSPGIFTASSLTLGGGSIINWQVSDAFGAAGIGYDQLAVTGNLDLRGASAANKIIIKISSITALDANGDPLYFGAPNGVASIRTFQFGQVGGVLLNSGENISDVFRFDVSDFTYTGGAASNAGLWSINWNSASGAITLTAVPEPSTYGIGLGALALAAAALRRRRKQTPAA
jgi:MYXO-CTERM domain-containing protein